MSVYVVSTLINVGLLNENLGLCLVWSYLVHSQKRNDHCFGGLYSLAKSQRKEAFATHHNRICLDESFKMRTCKPIFVLSVPLVFLPKVSASFRVHCNSAATCCECLGITFTDARRLSFLSHEAPPRPERPSFALDSTYGGGIHRRVVVKTDAISETANDDVFVACSS